MTNNVHNGTENVVDNNQNQGIQRQINQIVEFLETRFGDSFQTRIQKLETNDTVLEAKINEMLDRINSLRTQCPHDINKNPFNCQQTSSINSPKVLEFIEKCQYKHLDLSNDEFELSKMYNELLNFPSFLHQIDILRHHRILSKALELNESTFNYEQFITFIYESITKYKQPEIQSLLVYFDETTFSDFSVYNNQLKTHPEFEIQYLTHRNDRYMDLFNQRYKDEYHMKSITKQLEEIMKAVTNNQEEIEELKKGNSQLLNELQTSYQHQNEVIELKHIEIVKEMKEENRKLQTEISLLKTSNEELKKQNCQLTEELQKQFSELTNKLEIQQSKSTETNTQQLSKFENFQQNQSTILNIIQEIYNNYHQSFPFHCISQFDGVLNYLKQNGRIQLTSGHKEDNGCEISHLIDYSNTKDTCYAAPADKETNYFEVNFFNRKIDLSSYQIKSYWGSINDYHPKTWEIRGSNDRTKWDPLDRRENCSDLNAARVTKHFICQNPTHKHYQYIRFYQYESWRSDRPYYIKIERFELYGDIYKT